MKERTACFYWNCVADFQLDERLDHHVRHEADRLCQLCTQRGRGKHHLLIRLHRGAETKYEASLTCRHGAFVFHASDRAADAIMAFEGAATKLEEHLKRPYRFRRRRSPGPPGPIVEPVERTGPRAPQSPEEVLIEMLGDYSRRLQRFVRRRLRSEALVHPDWPVAGISDGEVVDEAVLRLSGKHPAVIPWGAFWPWAIGVCEDVLQEFLQETRIASQSSVSLDADLPESEDWDPGYDAEHPYYILERILYPDEEEVEDATPDERAAAPSTVAEYEDFTRYLRQTMANWPERDQRLVELFCFEGLQPREIAPILNCETTEVLELLNQSLPKLRQLMGEFPDRRRL